MQEKDLERILKIHGWTSKAELETLFTLARECLPNTIIVEIGCWKGRSTMALGLGAQTGNKNKVYAIDHHTGSEEHREWYGKVWTLPVFEANVKKFGLQDTVKTCLMTSQAAVQAIQEPIGLLFIDGSHEYESAKKDFDLWFPKLSKDGTIAVHDATTWPGPKRMVSEEFDRHEFSAFGITESLAFAKKG